MGSITKGDFSKLPLSFAIANIAVLIYCLPLIILGQDAYVLIGDNLDSHIVWYRVLAKNGLVFANSNTPISEIMSTPRVSLYNEFFLLFWIHYFFDTFPALVINKILIHFTALWGMFILLRSLNMTMIAVIFGAIFFAFLPFSQFWGLSIAGQPWVLFVFLQMERKTLSIQSFAILAVYVLYSNFYSVSFFFLVVLSLFYLTNFINNKSINWRIVFTIIAMVLLSIGMEYRLIDSLFFNQSHVSAREDRNQQFFSVGLFYLPKVVLLGHYTARSFLIFFVPIIVYASWLSYQKRKFTIQWQLKFLLIAFCVTICIVAVPHIYFLFDLYKNSFLNTFGFDGFYTILPFWTVLIGAISVNFVIRYGNFLKPLYVYLILSACIVGLSNPTILALMPGNKRIGEKEKLSYREFFAEELFMELDEYINKDQKTYKVSSLGLHPSIAQYNGFHTIDGYLTNYPMAYKREFRKIIANELSKNAEIRAYFDYWGSRCYLFDDELGKDFLITKGKSKPISLLDIDCVQFKKMGGRYIISAVQIEKFSCTNSNINLHRTFEDSCWKLYLYEIR